MPEQELQPRPSTALTAHDLKRPVAPAVRRLRITMVIVCIVFLLVVLPLLNLTGVVAVVDMNRIGRYLCVAIAVVGVDIVWGYTGMLSLCQAVFFCLGAYAMAMHLSLPQGGGDVRAIYNNLPQFLYFANPNSTTLPAFWLPFRSLGFSLFAAVFIPALSATVLGFFIFRSRVRGVYFAIITQALAWGVFLAFNRNELLLGGTNGLTNFYKPLTGSEGWVLGLYLASAVALLGAIGAGTYLVRCRLGRLMIATRDREMRLYFAGYRPEMFKVFAFVAAAVFAAIGGILYVPQNGIITPNTMRVEDSILLVVCVALGGRGTLWGAAAGGLTFYFLQSTLTSDVPSAWPFVLGAAVVAIVLFLPDGLATLWRRMEARITERAGAARIALSAVPMTAIALFLLAQETGLMPGFLNRMAEPLPLHWKYVLLIAVLGASAAAELVLARRDRVMAALSSATKEPPPPQNADQAEMARTIVNGSAP